MRLEDLLELGMLLNENRQAKGERMSISHVLLFLTYRCNLHCSFCLSFNGYWQVEPSLSLPHAVEPKFSLRPARLVREMSTSDIVDRVIPQFLESNVQVVALSGGEVLVRHDIETIFRALRDSKLRWCFDSTLMLCTQPVAETIICASCDSVLVSLDGSRDIHNKLRRNPKAYDKTLAGLQRLLSARNQSGKSKTRVILNFVLQAGNESSPPHIVEIAADYGADEVQFQLLSERNYQHPFSAEIAAKSMHKAFELANDCGLPASLYPVSNPDVENLALWFSMPKSKLQPDDYYKHCDYIYNNLRIDPEGNVIPCLEYKLGNILQEDLLDIWNGSAYKAFREHLALSGPFDACLRCCNIQHERSTQDQRAYFPEKSS